MASRQGLDKSMSAPISLGGLFPDSSDEEGGGFCNDAEESCVTLAGLQIRLRERPFHPLNANAVWPGAHVLAEWVRANCAARLQGRRVLELGSATGALAIFCVRACGLDVTTSDVDDGEVEAQVAENFVLNGLKPPPHLAHTWGSPLPAATPRFDVVLASDILLYVRAYPALVDTLEALCAPKAGVPGATFFMSWQRRLKESEAFFDLARARGFRVTHIGSLIFEIAYDRLPQPELD